MKVTVCFGNVRVVVPCGDGDILVRDLIREATLRYKKAVGKGPDSWVSVHNLQTQGGGILDPDDRLNDVADDREQIVASFEDGDGAHHHAGGDGASGSSVGTGSPDLFNDGDHKYAPPYHRTDIEVTGEQIASGLSGALQVRRGSEPALNQLPVGPPVPSDHNKRWSAAPLIVEPPSSTTSYLRPLWNEETKEEEEELGFRRVGRDGSNRLSMQFLGDGAGYRWAEAAERAAQSRATTSLPRESKRKEPLGQANITTSPLPSIEDINSSGELIIIRNEPGPLGIHVVPDYDRLGKDRGLLVQGIEPGGRIDRDGRLAVFDRIIEINGQNLLNMPFQRVQEMFKLSLTSPELRLRVIKSSGMDGSRKPPPPVYPRFPEDKENVSMVECEQKQSTNTKVATVSPTKKLPAPSRNLKSLLSANTRKIGKKIELELTKGPHGLGFSITTRDNPAGGNCPIYIKNIIPKGAAVEDGRLKIGDRLLEVNGVEMTGKSQSEAVAVLRNAPSGSKVKIVVSRQEDVIDNSQPTNNTNSLPRIIGGESESYEKEENEPGEVTKASDTPPNIPPLPQSHLQMQRTRTPEKSSSVAKIISQFQEATSPPSKVDDMIFPWKHREILTFNIPVHDSEKAGLGISVKGKTSDSQDLGIFIKSVINGGAASRDKRLRTNDQLLNVNGISLLQQSNSDAMETLRKAMLHTEGLIPGNITLTIARRVASPDSTRRSQSRSDPNLLCSTGDNSNETEPSGNENSGTSSSSTNTVIFNPHESSKPCPPQSLSPMHTWNPVLQRLTGCNKQALRNESYYKAAHESWSASTLGNNSYGSNCTTTNINTEEPILIEDEYGSRIVPQNPKSKSPLIVKTLSNGSLENRNDHEPDGKASLTGSNCDKNTDTSSQTTVITGADATYASQLSLENPAGFSRDAFGRQSMSEKRHATLDAKNTDTYQRSKKLREERDKHRETNLVRVGSVESIISVNRATEHPEYADKLGQLGPSLGMKKSSSLESLQTMVQEIQMQEEGDPAYSYRTTAGGLKVIRGRGCEESFRAAVVDKHLVDPNHRSEITAKKHWLLDPPTDHEREIDGFTSVRGGPRQSSLNAALDRKHKSAKKKQGIFKGIGSMFRFGKHRKIDFNTAAATEQQYANANELESENYVLRTRQGHRDGDGNIGGQLEDGGGAGGEGHANERVQQEREREREQMYQKHGFVHRHAEQVQVIPENAVAPPVKYRSNISGEHIQRRSDRSNQNKNHNQRLLHRHSHYPSDETPYEHITRKRIEQTINAYGSDFGRPGSRSGISEHPPFTHYVNYNELQTHISRKQHQYHSQRQPRSDHSDSQLRPVSNFYEYESIQTILNSQAGRKHNNNNNMAVHVVHPSQSQMMVHEMNGNLYQRHHQQQQQQQQGMNMKYVNGRSFGQQHHQQSRGPFITQVTIGEHKQPNGTKV